MMTPIGPVKSAFVRVLFLLVLVLVPLVPSALAQRPPQRSKLQIHPSARSLIESYERLVAGTGISKCNVGPNSSPTYNVSSAINTGYSTVRIPYTSFYQEQNPYFRTVWAAQAGSYTYYGACPPPSPIGYPLNAGNTENHVFAARLVPVEAYQAFRGDKSYAGLEGVGQVYVQDISQISDVYLEGDGGFIAKTEPTSYNNPFSSKGIVVVAQLKQRKEPALFYIINNYDAAGTLDWKFSTCWLLDRACR